MGRYEQILHSKIVISAYFVLKCREYYLYWRKTNMENQVWLKVALFLKELRCEDIKWFHFRNFVLRLCGEYHAAATI